MQNMQNVEDMQKMQYIQYMQSQTYQTKPNLLHQAHQMPPTKPNLPIKTYQTKPTKLNKPTCICFYWFPAFVTIGCAMSGVIVCCERGCVNFLMIDFVKAVNAWIRSAFVNVCYMYQDYLFFVPFYSSIISSYVFDKDVRYSGVRITNLLQSQC